MVRLHFVAMFFGMIAASAHAVPASTHQAAIEAYVRPYSDTNNFWGAILAARNGSPVFARAFGFADRERQVPNSLKTKFHIASMSMQFTAAAALRLAMQRRLSLDTPVSRFVPELPNAQKITVRDLLKQTSGIHDINSLPDYDAALRKHQTPSSLVEKIRALPPRHQPGSYEGEEHSAYNLLALIIERRSGLPFASAIKRLVFDPLRMNASGIDDDRSASPNRPAGYAPSGVKDLERAVAIHWSAKAGNGSAYTTAADELRFMRGLLSPRFLSPELRKEVFDLSSAVGFGWFKSNSNRFGGPVYSMSGRAPGFASAVIYIPHDRLFVVALSNVYASFTPTMATDIAAILSDRPFEPLRLKTIADAASFAGLPARFKFGPDFYQSNAVLQLGVQRGEVSITWPNGDTSPLIPVATDRFIDRAYGVPVEITRGQRGEPVGLKYDRFKGDAFAG
jgi:CubicO group peptidase (beta-lactamase class C family)